MALLFQLLKQPHLTVAPLAWRAACDAESEGGLQKVRGTQEAKEGERREGVATKMHSPPHDWLSLARCLKGKRIIIMGDSTARFEYLTLAFIAHFGMAPSEALPECHKIWGNVNASQVRLPPKAEGCMFGNRYVGKSAFYTFTNELFGGHELCDCHRAGCSQFSRPGPRHWTPRQSALRLRQPRARAQWLAEPLPRGVRGARAPPRAPGRSLSGCLPSCF